MKDDEDTSSRPSETYFLNSLSRIQIAAEKINAACSEALNRVQNPQGFKMAGARRRIETEIKKIFDESNDMLNILGVTTYKKINTYDVEPDTLVKKPSPFPGPNKPKKS